MKLASYKTRGCNHFGVVLGEGAGAAGGACIIRKPGDGMVCGMAVKLLHNSVAAEA